jgi:hypothetical protein
MWDEQGLAEHASVAACGPAACSKGERLVDCRAMLVGHCGGERGGGQVGLGRDIANGYRDAFRLAA